MKPIYMGLTISIAGLKFFHCLFNGFINGASVVDSVVISAWNQGYGTSGSTSHLLQVDRRYFVLTSIYVSKVYIIGYHHVYKYIIQAQFPRYLKIIIRTNFHLFILASWISQIEQRKSKRTSGISRQVWIPPPRVISSRLYITSQVLAFIWIGRTLGADLLFYKDRFLLKNRATIAFMHCYSYWCTMTTSCSLSPHGLADCCDHVKARIQIHQSSDTLMEGTYKFDRILSFKWLLRSRK